ncbi:MAG: pyruvate, phosphate dikinase [Spirochaetales bacterium]|nr:pyruvate, phosphate dikinase [Spirochaetales bacterium]
MKNNIHFFSAHEHISKKAVLGNIGIRGRRAMELAALDLPILPGFIFDSEVASKLENTDLKPHLKSFIAKVEKITGKKYGDSQNPMLVKIVISPNLVIVNYPTLHNFGLVKSNVTAFNKYVGENFGIHEMQFLMKGCLEIEARIAELKNKEDDKKKIQAAIGVLTKELKTDISAAQRKQSITKYASLLPQGFFSDPYSQLEIELKRISCMLRLDEMDDQDTALLIQPMVYGNYGEDSASGMFFSRNIVTGEKKLDGKYFQNKFDEIGAEGNPINKIQTTYLTKLEKIALNIEDHFKEIRSIRFTIEDKRLWLIDQRGVMNKSTRADIQLMLDLYKRKVVDPEYLVKQIKPNQLSEILHPVIDLSSTKNMRQIAGGIAGAPGAAIGKVYFNTEKLLDAYKKAQQADEDTRFILCMPATFAEDVKAIEVATGVLSCEGGYSAHASVVARQYGKVSLVSTIMRISTNSAVIGSVTIKEGDYLTLNVPYYGKPTIFLGTAELIEPDPKESGLLEYLDVVDGFVKEFHVRANADSPRDATLARTFGARGIGLCRTEHMFFAEKRINVFREMVIADTEKERMVALEKLRPMQKADFYKLFKIMQGYVVTIRLLDAPLHEFLPHNPDEMKKFLDYLDDQDKTKKLPTKEVIARCETLDEFNPMLGHRGCRIAVSYPEIYAMQMRAIFEAVYTLQKEGINVKPEIMIPLIMNENELKMVIYGKKIEGQSIKGLAEIEKEVRDKIGAKPVKYKIGTMIELPGAALGAAEIAKYAEFFSFGTNDLTQTTMGLSRDDFNTFMPDYTQFDLLEGNPFRILNKQVKELIAIAVRRGTMTRPKLKKGLCGEHGAAPENIKFCMDIGLNYVSCSSYSVPIAKLAVAQLTLEAEE